MVDVGLDGRAHVDHHRGEDEVAGVQLSGAARTDVEMTRRAVVRPGVLTFFDVLQRESVFWHGEHGPHGEGGVAREHRRMCGVIQVAQEHGLRETR
jgi:hypothetical protein